jgi:hypothetical protein
MALWHASTHAKRKGCFGRLHIWTANRNTHVQSFATLQESYRRSQRKQIAFQNHCVWLLKHQTHYLEHAELRAGYFRQQEQSWTSTSPNSPATYMYLSLQNIGIMAVPSKTPVNHH